MADEQGKQPAPQSVCRTCMGARKVYTYAVVDGRSRTVWMTCPTCNAPSRPVTGP